MTKNSLFYEVLYKHFEKQSKGVVRTLAVSFLFFFFFLNDKTYERYIITICFFPVILLN